MAVESVSLGQYHPPMCYKCSYIANRDWNSFDTRDTCEEVIKSFNNHTIKSSGDDLLIQIRYADTQEQKSLKQQTQAARQFRSAEYEYATQAWRQGRLPLAGSTAHADSNANEFNQYLGGAAAVPIQGQRWAQSALRQVPGRSPLGALPNNTGITHQPLVQINVGSSSDGQGNSSPDGESKPANGLVNNLIDNSTSSDKE